ncbi:MAG: hypothetical protein IJ575_10090 [Selenomonadaceae bacterium]|nr:hypothetical protein [Selenomonadaceae bacterium]
MQIKITDDFDLDKIIESGQCFRPRKIQDRYRFITKNHVLYIRQIEDEYEISCSAEEWNQIWLKYFDLETNYSSLRYKINRKARNEFINQAVEFGKGIRILRQDPLETLISFIISQRKSIPAIRSSVEKICDRFGTEIETEFESSVHLFPTIDQISQAAEEDLKSMALGYRVPYIIDAIQKLTREIEDESEKTDLEKIFPIDLEKLNDFSNEKLLETLQRIHGVGKKIANCVALYSYHRLNCVPIDVWIERAMLEDLEGMNLKRAFGDFSGLVQQYVYFYKRGKSDG